MAGYDPKRPRPTDGPRLVGLPGDPAPEPDPDRPVSVVPDAMSDDPPPAPTRRVLPRPAPPLDRRLPPAVVGSTLVALVLVFVIWRRTRRR